MKVTGVIAEFNPFHNGHKYLLDQIDGLKIVAMSGNFMQRGEPALVDKWTRAQMAVDNGADIVVELPFLVSVQAADYFAQGSVDILDKLQIDQLAFGTEDNTDYNRLAQVYEHKEAEMLAFLESQPNHLSYPQKNQAMWESFAGIQFSGNTPNHILALAYTKAVAKKDIHLFPIQRQGAGFHSIEKNVSYASATSLRKHIKDKDFVNKFTPSSALIHSCPQVSWDNYFELLKYQILSHQNLKDIYQVNDEMASKMKQVIKETKTFEDLVNSLTTKRFTKARVRRLLTYVLINVTEEDLPQKIHILAFSKDGQNYLSTLKKEVPYISRIGKEPWDRITQKADAIYQLGDTEIIEQNFGRIPIKIKKRC